MKLIPQAIRQRLRRHFGTVSIDDPRPVAASAPYTYFLPSENELLAIGEGDLVKINVRSHPPSPEWDAERVWFIVTATSDDELTGKLDNLPLDIPQLAYGDELKFKRTDVIDIDWAETHTSPPPPQTPRREYWDRCLVDQGVLDGEMPVHFIYRDPADLTETDDRYPDSGWRIRGDYRGVSDEEVDARETAYVALGAVLNRDDRWLEKIDAPPGSAFIRDWDADVFVPYGDDGD